MSDSTNGIPKIKLEEVTTPGLGMKSSKESQFDMSKYNVRVARFVLGQDMDDQTMLESLLTKGMNPSDDSIYLIDKKDSFFQDTFTTVITYIEKKIG